MTTCTTAQDQQNSVTAETNYLLPAGIIVTYSNLITNSRTTSRTFESVAEEIRTSESLRASIESLRTIPEQIDRQEFKKQYLPWISFSQFKNGVRLNENFLSSEFMVIDLDHLGDRFSATRTRLIHHPNVFSAFTSPGGDGIKVVFALTGPIVNEVDFRAAHGELQAFVSKEFGTEPDTHDDPARACYLSSDPEIYINTAAERFIAILKKRPVEAKPIEPATDLLPAFSGSTSPGRTHKLTQLAGSFIHAGYNESYAIEWLKMWDQVEIPRRLGTKK